MHIFQALDLQALPDFPEQQDQLAVVKRQPLEGAEVFFQELMQTPFGVIGKVFKETSFEDITTCLKKTSQLSYKLTLFMNAGFLIWQMFAAPFAIPWRPKRLTFVWGLSVVAGAITQTMCHCVHL